MTEESMSNPSVDSNQNRDNEDEVCLQMVIDVEPSYKAASRALEERTKKAPELLCSTAGDISCTIFRVPQKIKELQPSSFQPGLVSIGPYYHGEKHLKMMEQHKSLILGHILKRIQGLGVVLDRFFAAMDHELLNRIRGCYSENIGKYNNDELASMMILDGCFIIELLCVVNKEIIPEASDPISSMPCMIPSLVRDLLLLGNQIPFFVLRILYDLCIPKPCRMYDASLEELVIGLINFSLPRPGNVSDLCRKYKDCEGEREHILDFYRSTFIPIENNDQAGHGEMSVWRRFCCCLGACSSSINEEETNQKAHEETTDRRDTVTSQQNETTDRISLLSEKDKNTTELGDAVQYLSEHETSTDGRKSLMSSYQSEITIEMNSLQLSSEQEEIAAVECDRGQDLHENEGTTEMEESSQLIQPTDEPRGVVNMLKNVCRLVGIRFTKKDDTNECLLKFIQPVEKLLQAGIKFKKRKGTDSFLDIDFSHGALRIPVLTTGETMSTFILNCIAFEQCYKYRSKHFTSYFNFMGYLINSTNDAGYLREVKIIENFFGTDQELVNFFNEVGKNIPYYFQEDYLMEVAQNVEIHNRNNWHARWAEFKYKYFGSVWIGLSAFAALYVIILTTLQAFYALYRYYKNE